MNSQTPDPSIPQPNNAGYAMPPAVQARLLQLNRQFYATVAGEFDRSRQGLPAGMLELAARLDTYLRDRQPQPVPLRLLDVGCGNGRLARALAQRGPACDYTGLDGDPQLLALAAEQTRALPRVAARFVAADLAQPDWAQRLPDRSLYAAVVCLAVLHHFPGLALRQRLVGELAALVEEGGLLALSTWQFLSSERLAGKQVAWAAAGVDPAAVEPGDALLPWNQGAPALRYVHQLDLAEVTALAAAAGLQLVDSFRADGKEGNLNLYTLWQRQGQR